MVVCENLGVMPLMVMCHPSERNDDGGDAVRSQFAQVTGASTTERDCCEGIEVWELVVDDVALPISSPLFGARFPFSCEVYDVDLAEDFLERVGDEVIEELCTFTPPKNKEDRALP